MRKVGQDPSNKENCGPTAMLPFPCRFLRGIRVTFWGAAQSFHSWASSSPCQAQRSANSFFYFEQRGRRARPRSVLNIQLTQGVCALVQASGCQRSQTICLDCPEPLLRGTEPGNNVPHLAACVTSLLGSGDSNNKHACWHLELLKGILSSSGKAKQDSRTHVPSAARMAGDEAIVENNNKTGPGEALNCGWNPLWQTGNPK